MTGQLTDLIHRLHLQMDLLSAIGLQTFSVSLSSLSVVRSSGSYRPRPRPDRPSLCQQDGIACSLSVRITGDNVEVRNV